MTVPDQISGPLRGGFFRVRLSCWQRSSILDPTSGPSRSEHRLTAVVKNLSLTPNFLCSAEFVEFLHQIVASQPPGKAIHVIADNLSAHKTKLVAAFLQAHPNVSLHFTPTYSSWLNQVENWFAKIQRHVITRGVFRSLPDLPTKLLRYIRHYNKTATPIKWTYSNPKHRIKP